MVSEPQQTVCSGTRALQAMSSATIMRRVNCFVGRCITIAFGQKKVSGLEAIIIHIFFTRVLQDTMETVFRGNT